MGGNTKAGDKKRTGKKSDTESGLSRRKFMAAGAVGTAGLAVSACECRERCQDNFGDGNDGALPGAVNITGIAPRELKMVTTWPRDFPGLGTGADNVARYITEMSGGSLRVKLYAAGELVGAFDVFDAVAGGSADFYHGAEYYWTNRSRAYPFFTAVPFGMTASEIMGWCEYGDGQALWDELAAPFNIKPFAAGNTGHQMGGWFRREINSLEDLRGLKIRMPGIGGEVMSRAGASAVTIPGSEIYQALQSGTVDATEWVGPWNDVALGFYREAKLYYWPGFHEPGAQLATGVNLDLWNDLSVQQKSIVTNACRAANNQMIAQYAYNNGVSLETLTQRYGVELRQMPDDVLAALATSTREVLQEISEIDDISKRIFESYRDALRRSTEWNRISDEAYMAARRQLFEL